MISNVEILKVNKKSQNLINSLILNSEKSISKVENKNNNNINKNYKLFYKWNDINKLDKINNLYEMNINELLFLKIKILCKWENIMSLEWSSTKQYMKKVNVNINSLENVIKNLNNSYKHIKDKTELKLIYSKHQYNKLLKLEENKNLILQKFSLCEKDLNSIFLNK